MADCEKCLHYEVCDRSSHLIWDEIYKHGCLDFMGWIPVSERLPEPFELVYVYVPTEQKVADAYMTLHKEWVGFRMNREVTHWMPLPGPPVAEKEKQLEKGNSYGI